MKINKKFGFSPGEIIVRRATIVKWKPKEKYGIFEAFQ